MTSNDGAGRRQLSVAALKAEDVEELFEIVADLEAAAVRKLAGLDPADRSALAGDLSAANRRFADVVGEVPLDFERAYESHRTFHSSLTDHLAGPRLSILLTQIRAQLERYEWAYGVLLEGELDVAVWEHDAVVRAVEAGDARAAEEALRGNWENASTRLRAVIHRVGERGTW